MLVKIGIGLIWAVVAMIPVGFIAFAYFRISGDLSVCKNYYPEMNTLSCYFSSKTVRVPNK